MYWNQAASRPFLVSAIFLAAFAPAYCQAKPFQNQPQEQATAEQTPLIQKALAKEAVISPAASPTIVIGFLGGHVKKTNTIHTEVQIAMRLRRTHPTGLYAEVFQNAHGQQALDEIRHLLDANHDGVVSLAEKQHARIILYGHSWGATQTVATARQLEGYGIPVLLTILVDRVPKFGGGDERIPSNVAQAINFYQRNGLLHGLSTIRAEDPATTKILGNVQFDYSRTHVACDRYPWFARTFMGPHIEIENDPRVWDQIESLIASTLQPEKSPTTVALMPH